MEKVRTKTLLIGCGGSGIATLLRLNELMASKADFREEMKESIFYYVLDTAAGDVLGDPGQNKPGFKEIIAAQMGGAKAPFALPVHLTEGYHQVSEMLSDSFYSKDDELASKMKQFWWYSKAGKPFSGIWINNPEQGAAQCPQVSYLAAWNHLPQIENDIKTVLHAIKTSNSERNALSKLNVYIVAGLAGGTGRGSWNLVAFKIRQCLLEEGVTVPMDAIFFDATCWPDVAEPDQKEGMAFNSATAMSELSAWFHMKEGLLPEGKEKPFGLPLTLPSPKDPSTETINFAGFESPDGRPPHLLQSAYVIFGENGFTPHLADNDQYHAMAAAALYAKIVNAAEIGEREINNRFEIGSFASTTFEVDSAHIQAYLQTAAQKAFLERQYADRDAERSKAEETAAIGAVGAKSAPKEESFLGKSHLWVPSKLACEPTDNTLKYKDVANPSLLQAMMEKIAAKVPALKTTQPKDDKGLVCGPEQLALTYQLRQELVSNGNDLDQITNWVAGSLPLKTALRDDAIRKCFNEILAAVKLDNENLKPTLRQLVMGQFARGGKSVSLHRAQFFTKALKEAFSQYVETLKNGTVKIDGSDCKKASGEQSALVESFQKAVKDRSGKEYGFIGDRFNRREIDELCEKFDRFAYAAVFFRVRDILREFFEQAVAELGVIDEHLRSMEKFFERANKALEENLKPVFGENFDYDKLFETLFTNSENRVAVQNGLPEPEDLESRFYRRLKPILSRADLYKLLTDEKNLYVDIDEVMAVIQTELQNLLDGGVYPTQTVAAIRIQKNISTVVTERVMVLPEFCTKFCSFEEVLKRNIDAWNDLLSRTVNGFGTLTDRFRAYLGLEDKDLAEDPATKKKVVILEDVLIQKMVRSLVLNCNPWIELHAQAQKSELPAECLVILPFAIDSNAEKQLKKEIKAVYGLGENDNSWAPRILHTGSNKTNGIPLNRVLVYTSKGLPVKKDQDREDGVYLDWLDSLSYWRQNAELLRQAEDLNHDSAAMFPATGGGERSRTFAFLAPFFTTDFFRDMRWHPWLKKDQK